MSDQLETPPRTRLYFTGDCDGFADLREALSQHPELEVIGSSEHVAQASGVLAEIQMAIAWRNGYAPVVPLLLVKDNDRGAAEIFSRHGRRETITFCHC